MAQTTEPPETGVTEPPETGVTDPPPADDVEGDGTETPNSANPPAYIRKMVEDQVLTQEQVDTLRTGGYGWGEVRIATRLAQQMVANSAEGLTFEDALAQVTAARAAGKGFGQIAAENNLKIGQLVGQRKARDTQKGSAAQKGTRTRAAEVSGDETVTPDPANPPAYIREMVQAQVVTQQQVDTMLATGYGWGEVRIASLMAQRIAANSNAALTFDAALAQVMAARAEGKDFGQIAADNNLKVGDLVGKKGSGGKTAGTTTANAKKPGFFARVGKFLGLGRDKPAQEESPKASQADKPERPERAARAEKPEKPETPARVEKPERPEKPTRPEKPERGPQR